ncbi:MAG: hypothetical protein QHJ34_06700 [bacterium]|jgi:hypothetical protein|nr:hypothetical protein [candidate division KSB1 bacterium]MDH7559906.1 hypothetical protein [bacterium]
MSWSRKRLVLGGFIAGFTSCAVLLLVLASLAWQYRSRLASRFAQPYAAHLVAQVFRAVPDGYVTKNRERVLEVLDAFTNAVARRQVSEAQMRRVASLVLAALADGAFSYQELDQLLEAMQQSVPALQAGGREEGR